MITYGSETNGLITSLQQFIQYFTLLEAGLSGAAIFALYKPVIEWRCKHDRKNSIFCEANVWKTGKSIYNLGYDFFFAVSVFYRRNGVFPSNSHGSFLYDRAEWGDAVVIYWKIQGTAKCLSKQQIYCSN